MTNEKAKLISKARRKLNKATENYLRTGDTECVGSILEMQNLLNDTYNRSDMIYYINGK